MLPFLLRQPAFLLLIAAPLVLLVGCGDDAEPPPPQTAVEGVWTSAADSAGERPRATDLPGGAGPLPASTVAEPESSVLDAMPASESGADASASASTSAATAESAAESDFTQPGGVSTFPAPSSDDSAPGSSPAGDSEGVVSEGLPVELILGELRATLPAGLYPAGTRVRLVEEGDDAALLEALLFAFPEAVAQVRTWFRLEASLPPLLLPPEATLEICLVQENDAAATPLALAQSPDAVTSWQVDPFPEAGAEERCIGGVSPADLLALVECAAEGCTP